MFNKGNKVYFGPYGDVDKSRIWNIIDISYSDVLQCNTYGLEDDQDRHVLAYEDEIELVR